MNKEHRQHVKLGVLPDPRSAEERGGDIHYNQIASGVKVNWTEKPQSAWRKYTIRDQDGASDCVANGTAKALEAKDGIVYSAHPIYSRRSNKPDLGMWPDNAATIVETYGTTTEALDPSNEMGEGALDAPVTLDTPKRTAGHGFISITDLDAIANAVDTFGGVVVTVSIAWTEWDSEQGIPKYIPGAPVDLGHCLCAVDYTLHNGEKALVAENSWGNDDDSIGQTGQVILTQSFLNARGVQAMFMIPANPIPPVPTLVEIVRVKDDGIQTTGKLVTAGFDCDTLELPWKDGTDNISCIPVGTYRAVYTFWQSQGIYRYLLQDVPGKTGIFLHAGNYHTDTLGCILLGKGFADINHDGEPDLLNSRATLTAFETLMQKKDFTLIIRND